MEQRESQNAVNIGMSLLGVIGAIVVFVLVWIVGGALFNLFDHLRGLGNDKLQLIFRELFVPGVGGYVAMVVVQSKLPKANRRFVFFGFSASVLILVGMYIGFVGSVAGEIGTDFSAILVSAIPLPTAIIGAYIKVKKDI